MKLSEILKDWPKDNYYSHGSLSELPMDEVRSAFSEGYSTALTSCDREIDREALEEIIRENIYDLTSLEMSEKIISTMPNWLKRNDNGKI